MDGSGVCVCVCEVNDVMIQHLNTDGCLKKIHTHHLQMLIVIFHTFNSLLELLLYQYNIYIYLDLAQTRGFHSNKSSSTV